LFIIFLLMLINV